MTVESGEVARPVTEEIRDAQLEALADPLRRRLTTYLLEEEPASVTLSASVAHLASTTDRDYERVQTMMIHRHLPKLETAGVVSYSPREEQLTYVGDTFVTKVLDLL